MTHEQIHDINSSSDHSSTSTPGRLLKADANGLPIDSTKVEADIIPQKSINISMGSDTNPYSKSTTNSPTFQTSRAFVFPGTNDIGSPSKVNVLIDCKTSGKDCEWRIYDVTNAQVIVSGTITGTGSRQLVTVSSSSFTNSFSTSESVIEIQGAKAASNGDEAWIYDVEVRF